MRGYPRENKKANEDQARIILTSTNRNVRLRTGIVWSWAFFRSDEPPGIDRISLYAPGL